MKFNEKLIKLRKENGMSQELLGYELNVTRQTISKWELGISTPEMDKLVEISKLFGVSVDELINDGKTENTYGNYQTDNNNYVGVDSKYIPKDDTYNSEKEQDKIKKEEYLNKGKKIGKTIGKAYIIFFIIMIIFSIGTFIFVMFNMFNFSRNFSKTEIEINEENEKREVKNYNNEYERYGGINKPSMYAESVINNIIKNNNTNENKIIVNYNGKELKSNSEIENIKINDDCNYKITFEYNEEGYINKAIIQENDEEEISIENKKRKIEIYNSSFEFYGGINEAVIHVESLIN